MAPSSIGATSYPRAVSSILKSLNTWNSSLSNGKDVNLKSTRSPVSYDVQKSRAQAAQGRGLKGRLQRLARAGTTAVQRNACGRMTTAPSPPPARRFARTAGDSTSRLGGTTVGARPATAGAAQRRLRDSRGIAERRRTDAAPLTPRLRSPDATRAAHTRPAARSVPRGARPRSRRPAPSRGSGRHCARSTGGAR